MQSSKDSISQIPVTQIPSNKSHIFLEYIILAIVVFIGGGLFVLQRQVIQELRQENEKLREELSKISKTPYNQIPKSNIKPTSEFGEPTNARIQPSTIYSIDEKVEWEDDSVRYNLLKVFLSPDIVELGLAKENDDVKGKYFLIAEVNIDDLRTEGTQRIINQGQYLRIQEGDAYIAPIIGTYYSTLVPLQSHHVYIVFPVEKEKTNFKLLVGNLANPEELYLNFSDKNSTQTVVGYFHFKRGLLLNYP